jgi:hypothetical protein
MWVPAGFAYLAAISILFITWLREAERRSVAGLRRVAPLASLAALLVLSGCDDAGVGTRITDIGDPQKRCCVHRAGRLRLMPRHPRAGASGYPAFEVQIAYGGDVWARW